ncbi:MAG: TonB-dependent receptor [Gemmatimonadetes bacterium]|nr:TonB-dependent receptor [Gemmatimonadota bacterium]
MRVQALGAVNQYNIPGPLTAAQLAADPQQANATYLTRRERRDNQTLRIGSEVVHQFSEQLAVSAKAFVAPKHLERSERGTYRYFDRVHRGGSLLVEDVLGTAGTVSAGVDFARQDGPAHFWALTAAGEQGTTLSASKNEKATNTGVFVQHGVTLGRRLSLTTGLRYDAIDYELDDSLAPKLNATRRFSRVTPKLGLSLQVAPAAAFYASLGGGVESPAAKRDRLPRDVRSGHGDGDLPAACADPQHDRRGRLPAQRGRPDRMAARDEL